MTTEARRAPYAELAAAVHTLPWLDADTIRLLFDGATASTGAVTNPTY
jgi:hypothetical protein